MVTGCACEARTLRCSSKIRFRAESFEHRKMNVGVGNQNSAHFPFLCVVCLRTPNLSNELLGVQQSGGSRCSRVDFLRKRMRRAVFFMKNSEFHDFLVIFQFFTFFHRAKGGEAKTATPQP